MPRARQGMRSNDLAPRPAPMKPWEPGYKNQAQRAYELALAAEAALAAEDAATSTEAGHATDPATAIDPVAAAIDAVTPAPVADTPVPPPVQTPAPTPDALPPLQDGPVARADAIVAARLAQSLPSDPGAKPGDVIYVSATDEDARFDLILGPGLSIRGTYDTSGGTRLIFRVPEDLAPRADRHTFVLSGRLIRV